MSLPDSFGRQCYLARKELGYTQEQVAEAVSVSTRWYQEIEKGAVLPGGEVTLRLLLALKLDPERFRPAVKLITPKQGRRRGEHGGPDMPGPFDTGPAPLR